MVRGGAAYLLKVDVSQFYPSLYTHAVGWAVDPKLRDRANWSKTSLVGKQLDQSLMNLQGKVSQGIPIGNDISFLLAESVLSQIDKCLNVKAERTYRWFDDYEFACDTRKEAEQILAELQRQLDAYQLRLNPKKTQILELPQIASDNWHDILIDASKSAFSTPHAMVRFFDTAFGLVRQFPELPVLLYAIATLFQNHHPRDSVLRVAESCISQAILSEPGCAQKAFSLLQYWAINRCPINSALISHTVEQMVLRHEWRGASNDVAWALAFCIAQKLRLSRNAGRTLASMEDDVIAIQTLHANTLGLIDGFSTTAIEKHLKGASPDGNHWLALYEAVRHNYLPGLLSKVTSNTLLNDLLVQGVTFYRPTLPPYSLILHTGGAPDWITKKWISTVLKETPAQLMEIFPGDALLAILGRDVANVAYAEKNEIEIIGELFGMFEPEAQAFEPYT